MSQFSYAAIKLANKIHILSCVRSPLGGGEARAARPNPPTRSLSLFSLWVPLKLDRSLDPSPIIIKKPIVSTALIATTIWSSEDWILPFTLFVAGLKA